MDAIIYTSNTGYTKKFAEMLGTETGLPVYDLAEAEQKAAAGAEIIYLGWLKAGKIQGYDKAVKGYRVKAVVAVGMSASPEQRAGVRESYHLPEENFFLLQGGFDMERLSGLNRLMMKVMKSTVGRKLAQKPDRTGEEEEMLSLLLEGGSRVSREQLAPLLAWLAQQR